MINLFFFHILLPQEEVAAFDLGLCCAVEERGETPGREDSPSELGDAELDLGVDAKTGDDKTFGTNSYKKKRESLL